MATVITIACPECGGDFDGDNAKTEHECPGCGMEVENGTMPECN